MRAFLSPHLERSIVVLQLVLSIVLGRSLQHMYLAKSTQPFPRTWTKFAEFPSSELESFDFSCDVHISDLKLWLKVSVVIHIKKGMNFSKKKSGAKNSLLAFQAHSSTSGTKTETFPGWK